MEPAVLGVILDSSVMIDAERRRLDATGFLKHITAKMGEREAAICSISVAELAHGIHRADTAERRQLRRAFLDRPLRTYSLTMKYTESLSAWGSAVQDVVTAGRDAIVETAGSTLLGLYLGGSLVAGGFDPTVSDIDFVAILATGPSDEQAAALERMHRRLDQENPAWAGRLEVVYVSAARLREHRQGIPRMAVISPGEPFHVLSGGPDWVLTWYPFREETVALVGPEIRGMVPPIARDDFLAVVRDQLRRVPEWIKGDSTRGANAHAILTTCRGLYTIRFGVRPSKLEAAKWATGEFPQWASLIESALTWRKEQWTNPGTDQASVAATRRFVTEVAAE